MLSLSNAPFDVQLMAIFGVLGYTFVKLDCEPAPLLLGYIMGPMVEEDLRRAIALSRGDPIIFLERPSARGCSPWRCWRWSPSASRRARRARKGICGVVGWFTRGTASHIHRPHAMLPRYLSYFRKELTMARNSEVALTSRQEDDGAAALEKV